MKFVVRGRVWKLGDDVNTDLIVPGPYITLRDMNLLASHVLEEFIPNFAKNLKPGDIIVAGKNFGCGSSREIAPALLKHLNVGAIVAESFARIFFRNAINLGLPVIECKNISNKVDDEQQLEINLMLGKIRNLSTGEAYEGTRLPDFLLKIIEAGGALERLRRSLSRR